MSNFLEKLCCSSHNLNCVAINLSQTADDDNLILCVKCMADKMSFISSVILINDALLLMNEMKHKQYQIKKSSIEESLYKFQTSIEKIQTYIDWLINSLNKMLTQLNQEFEKYQKELNSMSEPKIENLEKQDLMLVKHLQSNNDLSIQTNQDEFYEFIKVAQIQLENLKTGDNLEEIINYFQEIQKQEQIKDKSVAQRIETKSEEDTPAIRFKCNKHGKEIIVFSLDPEAQGERMLCVECIPKFKYEMSTLEETNKIWIIHQEEVYDSNSSFIRQRQQQWKSIQEIIIENHQQKQKLQQELLALLQNKVDKLGKEFQELELNKTKIQLMGFEKLNEFRKLLIYYFKKIECLR